MKNQDGHGKTALHFAAAAGKTDVVAFIMAACGAGTIPSLTHLPHPLANALTHSLTHSFIHSLTHSLTYYLSRPYRFIQVSALTWFSEDGISPLDAAAAAGNYPIPFNK